MDAVMPKDKLFSHAQLHFCHLKVIRRHKRTLTTFIWSPVDIKSVYAKD
tara:strand:+ start:194 stop:340 length:147 start_codon:yes stop_codon:yes gene_type:complete